MRCAAKLNDGSKLAGARQRLRGLMHELDSYSSLVVKKTARGSKDLVKATRLFGFPLSPALLKSPWYESNCRNRRHSEFAEHLCEAIFCAPTVRLVTTHAAPPKVVHSAL